MTLGISFIVPTFNEEQYIGQCLDSIKRQMELSEIPTELILVDNNSTDNTINIAQQFTSQVLINPTKGSPSITRNIGARHAQYDIFCFIDGDCILSDNWTQRLITTFADENIGACGGPALSPHNGNWVERAWAPTISARFKKSNTALAGANFSIRRNLFESLQGFNESLISAEDDDLSKRVIASGLKICYDSNQYVIHLGYPKSLIGIFNKQIWHGSSQISAHGLIGDKVVMLTLFYLVTLVCLVLSLISFNTWSATIAGLLLATAPCLLVYARSKKFLNKNFYTYLKMYLISTAFLMGRTIGLIRELAQKLK